MRKTKKYKRKRRKTKKGGSFIGMLNKTSKMATNKFSKIPTNKFSKIPTNKFSKATKMVTNKLNQASQRATSQLNQASQMATSKLNQASQMANDQMKNNIEQIFKTPYIQKFIQKIKEKKTETESYIQKIKTNNIELLNESLKLNLDPKMIEQNQAILEFVKNNNALLIKVLKSDKLKLDILASGDEVRIQQMMLTILFDHKLDVLNPTFIASLSKLLIKLNNY